MAEEAPTKQAVQNGTGGHAATGQENGTKDTTGRFLLSTLRDGVKKAIPWFFTGAGFLMLVGVTGAAVAWFRLTSAELPASEILQRTGERNLNNYLASGALALALFAVLGLMSVVAVYAIDGQGRDTDRMRHGLIVLAATGILVAIWRTDHSDDVKWVASAVVTVLALVALLITRLPQVPDGQRETPPPDTQDGNLQQGNALQTSHPTVPTYSESIRIRARVPRDELLAVSIQMPPRPLRPAGPPVNKVTAALRNAGIGVTKEKVKEQDTNRTDRTRLTNRALLLVAVAAFLAGLGFWLLYDPWVGRSVWLACALAGVCFGVARASGTKFFKYGVVVFFSVVLYGAWITVSDISGTPKLPTVALLRTAEKGTTVSEVGLYIARTDHDYWLASVTMHCKNGQPDGSAPEPASGRVFSVPRKDVTDSATGAAGPLKDANMQAAQLKAELTARQPTPGPMRTLLPAPVTCAGPPTLAELDPVTAAPGEAVRVSGTGFGEEDTVWVSGTHADVTDRTPTSLVFTVPWTARSGFVEVRSKSSTSNSLFLTVASNRPPLARVRVSLVQPDAQTFELNGSSSTDPEGGRLTYHWVSGRSWRATGAIVRFTLPPGQQTATVTLTVTDNHQQGGTASVTLKTITLTTSQTFEVGKSTITPAGAHALQTLSNQLKAVTASITHVDVDGFTDYVGTPQYNLGLSMDRALAVERVLVKALHISPKLFTAHAYGESQAVSNQPSDSRREADRRVDVFVTLRQ